MEICRAMKEVAEVELSRFQSVRPGRLNVLQELRWTRISGAREFFADESRDHAKRRNQAQPRQHQRQPQKLNRVVL